MTDSPPNTQPPGVQTQPFPFIQISQELIAYVRSLKLTGTQYDLWLFLFSLDPYGDRWVEIPPPEELGNAFGVSDRTIQRAAQRLADCNLFDFQIERWKAKNSKRSIIFPQNSTDKGIQMSANGSFCPQLDPFVGNGISLSRVNQTSRPQPAQGKGLKNGDVPNNKQTLLEQTNTVPTHHPVSEPNEQEGDLVLTQLLLQVEQSGIRLNKTIRRTIQHLTQQLGIPAAATRIRNALSATQERQAQGTLRNPGGFFNKALKEGYTANRAKVEARKQQTITPSPPDFHAIELAINQALIKGDRAFALQKLQTLWTAGWHDSLAELLHLRRDWGFSLSNEGVRE